MLTHGTLLSGTRNWWGVCLRLNAVAIKLILARLLQNALYNMVVCHTVTIL